MVMLFTASVHKFITRKNVGNQAVVVLLNARFNIAIGRKLERFDNNTYGILADLWYISMEIQRIDQVASSKSGQVQQAYPLLKKAGSSRKKSRHTAPQSR